MNIVSQFKKGWQTSEFWVTAFMALAPFLTFISGKKIDTDTIATYISMAVPAASYVFGRSWLKGKRVHALAIAGAAPEDDPAFPVLPDEAQSPDVTPANAA